MDAELLVLGMELTVAVVERGHIAFSDYAQTMAEFSNIKMLPYIKAFYNGVRFWPGFEGYASQMTSSDEVEVFDISKLTVGQTAENEAEINKNIFYEENNDEELQEFKRTAFEVLRDNEGMECQDWIDCLAQENITADVFGNDDPPYVFSTLEDYWGSMDYEDPDTGLCFTYRDWALYFQNWTHIEVYNHIIKLLENAKQN